MRTDSQACLELRRGVLVGLAAGDMLGAPAEFLTPEAVRARYGEIAGPVAKSFGAFEAGEFTDDTQMALSILESYPADAGLVARARSAFREWLAARPRDVGVLTRQALASDGIAAWRASGRKSCGNGALMRAAASVAAGRTGRELLADAVLLGAITHADPRSLLACAVYCAGLDRLLQGLPYADAWEAALMALGGLDVFALARSLEGKYATEVEERRPQALAEVTAAVRAGLAGKGGGNSGFALTTLQTAIAHGGAATFGDGVLPIVRAGDDSDTVAAVAGGILGARGVLPPGAWLADLRCGERWSAWPLDDHVRGPEVVARFEQACRRAAGVCQPEGYPAGVPPFAVHRLHPQLLYGRNPLYAREVDALRAAGVTHILDLREALEWQQPGRLGAEAVAACASCGVARESVPVVDTAPPSADVFNRSVNYIDAAIHGGGVVFVHCRAGRERTGAVLLAWWLARGGDPGAFASHAPRLAPLRAQESAAAAWARRA